MDSVKQSIDTTLYAIETENGIESALVVKPCCSEVPVLAYLVTWGEPFDRIRASYSSVNDLPDARGLEKVAIPGSGGVIAPHLEGDYSSSIGERVAGNYYKNKFMEQGIDLYQE